jgi:Reverse transcriptase (RNA-dependent DNA polymerase)
MTRRHIRRGDDRRGREDLQYRCSDIVKLCGMERWSRGKERALCGQPVEAIQALFQRKRENGDISRVRFGVGTRRFMVSFDIQAGYRHFRLAPQMRNWFLFRYNGHFYRYIALPFGWGRGPMWFTQLTVPMVRKLRQQYRVLVYLDDFLICPVKAGRVASIRDCRKATQVIDKLLSSLGLTRHPTKEEWVGSTRVEHLRCMIDSDRMRFYIAPRKIAKVHGIARAFLRQGRQERRWVSRDRLRSFCDVCVSLSLAMPFARFYIMSLFSNMTRRPREGLASRNGNRCRLNHQSIRDLQMWRK